MPPPRMFEPPPPDYRPALARLDRETTARLTDYGTAQSFTLRATPPPTFEQSALFQPDTEPDHGPEPIPGQMDLEALEDEEPEPPQARTKTPTPPERGTPCRVKHSGLGTCRFYREHIGRTGAVSWLVVDEKCNQFHAYRPAAVKILRKRNHAHA